MKLGLALPVFGFQGGVERYAYDLAVALRARGHQAVLLHGPLRGRAPEAFAAAFTECVPEARAREAGALDVIYAQKITDPAALLPFGSTPVVLAAHDHDHTCARSHRYLPITHAPCHRAPGIGCALRGCAIVRAPPSSGQKITLVDPLALRARTRALAARAPFVACSRYIADRLIDAGIPAARVSVVHPIPPEAPRAITPRPAELRLLFVGQLLRGKGVEIAIDALARLPPGAILDVVGDGPSRPDLERRAGASRARVIFHGWRPPDAIDAFYDAASVVVVPSLWPEPFGMIGVEAMRRGRPVAGAAHGGIPEWMPRDGGGRLFAPGDPAALARAVLALHADREAGDRAREHASARFSRAAFVDAIERALTRPR